MVPPMPPAAPRAPGGMRLDGVQDLEQLKHALEALRKNLGGMQGDTGMSFDGASFEQILKMLEQFGAQPVPAPAPAQPQKKVRVRIASPGGKPSVQDVEIEGGVVKLRPAPAGR